MTIKIIIKTVLPTLGKKTKILAYCHPMFKIIVIPMSFINRDNFFINVFFVETINGFKMFGFA